MKLIFLSYRIVYQTDIPRLARQIFYSGTHTVSFSLCATILRVRSLLWSHKTAARDPSITSVFQVIL